MEDKDLQQLIKEIYPILPEKVRGLLRDDNWKKPLLPIKEKYSLSDEQYESLDGEVFVTLLALQPITIFEESVRESLSLTKEIAHDIYQDIHESLWLDVEEGLAALQIDESEDESASGIEIDRDAKRADSAPQKEAVSLSGKDPESLAVPIKKPEASTPQTTPTEVVVPSKKTEQEGLLDQIESPEKIPATQSIEEKLSRSTTTKAKKVASTTPYKGNDPYRESLE
jgi:hypothetical protein